MQVSQGRGWRNTWSLSLSSFRPPPEDMQPLIAYRVRGYAANPSAPRTCCPARRSHANGRVSQVHEPAGGFSVHVSRRVQRNPVAQSSSTEPTPGAQSEGIFAVVHFQWAAVSTLCFSTHRHSRRHGSRTGLRPSQSAQTWHRSAFCLRIASNVAGKFSWSVCHRTAHDHFSSVSSL